MFINQAFKSLHEWWRYLVGLIIVFIVTQLASLPLVFVGIFNINKAGGDITEIGNLEMLSKVIESNTLFFLLLFPFAIGLIALLLVIKYFHKQSLLKATTTRKKIDWKRFWAGFALIGITTITITLFDFYTNPDSYVVQFNWVPFLILAVIAIILVPFQTSLEEYLFRGYLMQGIGTATVSKKFPFVFSYLLVSTVLLVLVSNYFTIDILFLGLLVGFLIVLLFIIINASWIESLISSSRYRLFHAALKRNFTPLFITSVVFGLLHLSNPEVDKLGNLVMIYYIGTGFLLGIMTLIDEGMELALGFHLGNNLVAALLVTADWTVFQTNSILKDISDPSMSLEAILPVFIIYPIYLLILGKIFKWKNWKEKLFGKIEKPIEIIEETPNIANYEH
ncbi:MAG TPA: CPBP family glutamic-type intramembrane protease [Flavobacteriaceae bacterium]|nr:CPBP family glutamic-type intramembrane protease [Flavobacteriaceae bacterium]